MVVCATRSITGRGSRRYSTRRAKPTTPPCEDVAIHTPVRSAPSAIGCSESLSPCSKTTRSTTLRNDALDPHLHPSRKSRGTLDQRWGVHPGHESERHFIAGFRAYSSSKLCNLLTARALAESPEAKSHDISVVAYNPGFTPGTSLGRSWPIPVRLLLAAIGLMGPLLRFNTTSQAGGILAELTLGEIAAPNGRIYASLVKGLLTWPEPSDLARRDDLMNALWSDSARLLGLSA